MLPIEKLDQEWAVEEPEEEEIWYNCMQIMR